MVSHTDRSGVECSFKAIQRVARASYSQCSFFVPKVTSSTPDKSNVHIRHLQYEVNQFLSPPLSVGEGQEAVSITFSELRRNVAAIASALRACGVRQGDRVVGYLPNSSLAVEAMLATASIGAVWSSTSPDFGVSVSQLSLIPVLITITWWTFR